MDIDSIELRCKGNKLVGVRYAPQNGPAKKPAFLLLHGFPGAQKNADIAWVLARRGYVCLAPHYRGSWGSHGRYSFAGVIDDTRAALRALRRDPGVDQRRIGIMGLSMGGWAAINVAALDRGVAAVCAMAPMAGDRQWRDARSRDKVYGLASVLEYRSKAALWKEFKDVVLGRDPVRVIDRIAPRPLLLVHGSQDELLSCALSRALFTRARAPKRLVVIEGADHGFTEHRPRLCALIARWASRALPVR